MKPWSERNKEQKQVVVLIALVVVIAGLSLYQLVLVPLMGAGDASADLAKLELQLEEADRLLQAEDRLKEQVEALSAGLAKVHLEALPEREDALSWVTREIYRSAREIGLDIESVEQVPGNSSLWARSELKRTFMPFTVKTSVRCGYDQVVNLIDLLERRYPYATVGGISLSVQNLNPLKHRVELILEWPISQDPAWSETFFSPPEEPTI